MMRYPTLEACTSILFPLIRKQMVALEPAPLYQNERRGTDRLESTFALMQRDEYDGLLAKAAYLFCSIIDGHPFSNGNKRLAVALLTYFLLINGCRISAPNVEAVQQGLRDVFPNLHWENVHSFSFAHEYFFYHLALVIADRKQKGQMSFSEEQAAVATLLTEIVAVPGHI